MLKILFIKFAENFDWASVYHLLNYLSFLTLLIDHIIHLISILFFGCNIQFILI